MKSTIIFALALLSLIASPNAQESADELADFRNALDAKIAIENSKLNSSPQTILVRIDAKNPNDYPMPIFILRQEEDGWKTIKILGGLAPKAESAIELEIEARYDKEPLKKTRYAVVAKGQDGETHGAYFEIIEDWREYERSINNELTAALVIAVPALTALLIFLGVMVAQMQYAGKIRYEISRSFDGYKMAMVRDDSSAKSTVGQRIAEVLMRPSVLGLELACVGILVFIMSSFAVSRLGLVSGAMVMALSALGSFTVPFIYFLGAWYILKHEEGKHLKFFVAMFIWGMFVAFLSFMVSTILVSELEIIGLTSFLIIGTILITPVVEELLKGIGVFFISGHREFNDTLTGLLLGFTCGVGFAFLENWFYFSSKANPFDLGMGSWTVFILYRSFFNSLAHGCFTGVISATMGYVKGIPKLSKFSRLAFLPGLILAITIHAIFNISAVLDSFLLPTREAIFFVFNPMLIILLAALFFLLLVLALVDEKKRKMREEMQARLAQKPQ